MTLGRPSADEYSTFAKPYVDLVPGEDPIAIAAGQIDKTVALFRSVPESSGVFSYAAGKWTIKEMLLHMADTERIFATRLLRIARGDTAPLPGFDQDPYVLHSGANERTLASLADEFMAVRQSTLPLLRSLPSDAWARRGTVSNYSATPRGIAFVIAGHELHHVRLLTERYLPVLA